MREPRQAIFGHRWLNIGIGAVLGLVCLVLLLGTFYGNSRVAAATTTENAAVVARHAAPDSYADLVSRVAPAVVTVRSVRAVHQTQLSPGDDLLRRFFGDGAQIDPRALPHRQAGLGSGVIVTADGYILTNNHVVESAEKVRVDLTDGRSFEARIVGTDKPSDLAVLKIPATGLATLPLGDSDQARVGDVVLAIGNPLAVGQTVTMGIVSGKGRATGASDGAFEDFIQTDAPINQGNSGGALVNTRGELIGINSQILSPSGYNIGIGFAIPSNMAHGVLDQIVKTGTVRRGMLGITVQGVTADLAKSLGLQEARGAIVSDVKPDSPAARAGLQQGDVILALDGKPVDSSNALRNVVARLAPGTSVQLQVVRSGHERELTARLGELPTDEKAGDRGTPDTEGGRFGMAVEPLTPELARRLGVDAEHGVVVADLDPDGVAAEAGLQSGDVILQVNGKGVANGSELRESLRQATSDKPALLLVNRRGTNIFVTLGRE